MLAVLRDAAVEQGTDSFLYIYYYYFNIPCYNAISKYSVDPSGEQTIVVGCRVTDVNQMSICALLKVCHRASCYNLKVVSSSLTKTFF